MCPPRSILFLLELAWAFNKSRSIPYCAHWWKEWIWMNGLAWAAATVAAIQMPTQSLALSFRLLEQDRDERGLWVPCMFTVAAAAAPGTRNSISWQCESTELLLVSMPKGLIWWWMHCHNDKGLSMVREEAHKKELKHPFQAKESVWWCWMGCIRARLEP